jgi:hypothetical protein
MLQESSTIVFHNYFEYRQWWGKFPETSYTKEKCYWATPHDTWSWLCAQSVDASEIEYRTLIRGSYEFDKRTLETYYARSEAVIGVSDLAANQEIHVFGSLSIETVWDPKFMGAVDDLLKSLPDFRVLFEWYRDAVRQPTTIEVNLIYSEQRAALHRCRLDYLYERAK